MRAGQVRLTKPLCYMREQQALRRVRYLTCTRRECSSERRARCSGPIRHWLEELDDDQGSRPSLIVWWLSVSFMACHEIQTLSRPALINLQSSRTGHAARQQGPKPDNFDPHLSLKNDSRRPRMGRYQQQRRARLRSIQFQLGMRDQGSAEVLGFTYSRRPRPAESRRSDLDDPSVHLFAPIAMLVMKPSMTR